MSPLFARRRVAHPRVTSLTCSKGTTLVVLRVLLTGVQVVRSSWPAGRARALIVSDFLIPTADSSEWQRFQWLQIYRWQPSACGDSSCASLLARRWPEMWPLRRRGESVLLKLSMNNYYNSKYGTIEQDGQPFLKESKLRTARQPALGLG